MKNHPLKPDISFGKYVSLFRNGTLEMKSYPDKSLIYIIYSPNQIGVLIVVFVLVLIFPLLFVGEGRFTIFFLFFLALLIWQLYSLRSIVTVIEDKKYGNICVRKSGVLGTEVASTLTTVSVGDIENVEIKRHIQRYGDGFEVRLSFREEFISITGAGLSFAESQQFATIIRKVLKITREIVAVD